MAAEEDTLREIFCPGGILSRLLPGFEHRPQQLEMALLVWRCLSAGKHGLVEAGTGVGKSLAYLFPAALWTLATGYRLVISTHTINLQEQLVGRDVPAVGRVLKELGGPDLVAALVKGRGNYLCRRRLQVEYEAREAQTTFWTLTNEADESIRKLHDWTREETATGDRNDLPFTVPADIWVRVQSDSDECAGEKCPYREDCFFRRMRRRQEQAHLLITNHALLLSDLKIRLDTGGGGILAPHEAVVCDEAHHLDRVAGEYLGCRVTGYRFRYLADAVEQLISAPQMKEALSEQTRTLYRDLLARLLDTAVSFFTGLKQKAGARPVRLRAPLTGHDRLLADLERLEDALAQLAQTAISEEYSRVASNQVRRCRTLSRELEDTAAVSDEERAYWLEPMTGSRYGGVALCSAPLSVAETLSQHLFDRTSSVILTSATLAIEGDFRYTVESLGIPSPETLALGSPFDYRQQALLCVPEDANGRDPNQPGYLDYVTDKVREILDLTQGRAFILFTSYSALNRVYESLAPELEEKGYTPLRQGDASRDALVSSFRKDIRSVLFGVDSFWEGVDVPGEALSCVVITRLPFEVPDEPLVEARCEHLRRQGKDPFWEYSLPRAAIKLKQGFGRLIRSHRDRGAVVVLDHRLATRRYGRYLVRALPPARLSTDLADMASVLSQPRACTPDESRT
ncbi:MAG TPA: helicase [Firmicutes bacterium]|nr:helicase [Bacillota bacterium]